MKFSTWEEFQQSADYPKIEARCKRCRMVSSAGSPVWVIGLGTVYLSFGKRSVQSKDIDLQAVAEPLRFGLRYAWSQGRTLLVFALILAMIESTCDYIAYTTPLTPKFAFIVLVLFLAASAWLITVVHSFILESMWDGPSHSPLRLMLRSVIYLPKPLLSVSLLLLLAILYFMYFPPSVLLAVFFLWAPAFCIVESYTKEPEREDDEYDDETGMPFRGGRVSDSDRSELLSYKAPWELGFMRSVRFVYLHLGPSFQVAWLYWLAEVLPRSIVALIARDTNPGSPLVRTAETFAAASAGAFAIATSAAMFFLLLPDRARQEIHLPALHRIVGRTAHQLLPKRGASIFAVVLFTLLGISGSGFLLYREALASKIPDAVTIRGLDVQTRDKSVVAEFWMEDPGSEFRWFEPKRFRMELSSRVPNDSEESAKDKKQDGGEGKGKADAEQRHEKGDKVKMFLVLEDVAVYNAQGMKLMGYSFRPYREPIRVVATFRRPADLNSFTARYTLYYDNGLDWGLGESEEHELKRLGADKVSARN